MAFWNKKMKREVPQQLITEPQFPYQIAGETVLLTPSREGASDIAIVSFLANDDTHTPIQRHILSKLIDLVKQDYNYSYSNSGLQNIMTFEHVNVEQLRANGIPVSDKPALTSENLKSILKRMEQAYPTPEILSAENDQSNTENPKGVDGGHKNRLLEQSQGQATQIAAAVMQEVKKFIQDAPITQIAAMKASAQSKLWTALETRVQGQITQELQHSQQSKQ